MVAIFLLLFFIGVDVGSDETIISNLPKIGLNALVLTFGAVVGTIFISVFVYKYFFKD